MRRNRILALFFAMVIVGLVGWYGVQKVQHYQQYEAYLSNEMVNKVSTLGHTVLVNDQLLRDTLEAKEVKANDLETLEFNFNRIMVNAQDLDFMATSWDRARPEANHNETAMIAQKAWYLLNQMNQSNQEKGLYTVVLTPEQVEQLQPFQQVQQKWAEAVRATLPELSSEVDQIREEFRKNQSKDGISNAYWVNAIVELNHASQNSALLP